MTSTDLDAAAEHMREFADRTGLTSDRPPDRYLWTDAFAVCNLLGLARAKDDDAYREQARDLVDQVHDVLGQHREDDQREGWLSGLEGDEARAHPTRGGLRIGKEKPERAPDEPMDRDEEWDRDGQYFHYNTKWMHALDCMARATGDATYNRWARELAEASHDAFVYSPAGSDVPQMYWKMRIDLSAPLVESMAETDPVDGSVTARRLQVTAQTLNDDEGPSLEAAVRDFDAMIESRGLSSIDPLSLGGLLMEAHREGQLLAETDLGNRELFRTLLMSARRGLERYSARRDPRAPAERRTAFRELGLVVGLRALEQLEHRAEKDDALVPRGSTEASHLNALSNHLEFADVLVHFWQRADARDTDNWRDHENINQVMLATALAPSGYLDWDGEWDGSLTTRP